MKTAIKFGLAALAAGTFSTLASQADTPDATFAFTKHGLPVPGAYFEARESQQATTLAVTKSGVGVGQVKASKHRKHQENALAQVSSPNSGS